MPNRFFAHGDIVFGNGAIQELAGMIHAYHAAKTMVVYGPNVKAAGIAQEVLHELSTVDIEPVIFDRVASDPTNECVEAAAGLAKKEHIELFIAIGGGSCIDLAKAINILMTNPGPISQYGGIGLVRNPVLPLIAIPTTAGTSSEVTNVVALTDTDAVRKYVIIDNKITPDAVIADPRFTKTMPSSVTANTGMDAITHAVESYISTMANSLTEYHSLRGLQLFHKFLPRAVKTGTDLEAREQMMLGCIITGFGFSNANLGLAHGIAHALSAHLHLAHGAANAAVLPYVLEFNAASCPQKMIDLAKAIDLPVSGITSVDQFLISKELVRFTKQLGIKTLGEQGVHEADFAVLTKDILREPVLMFNPRQCITREQVYSVLRKAL